MGRHALRITILLGVLITLVGGTGIFAVFTDRATAGGNDVTSGARPKAADLRIESAAWVDVSGASVDCDEDQDGILWDRDDTATAQFTLGGVQPGQDPLVSAPAGIPSGSYVCLKNVGSASLALAASAISLSDLDVGCTGDELTVDPTCGEDAAMQPQAGELSSLLTVQMERVVCGDGLMPYQAQQPMALSAFTDVAFTNAQLGPNEIACVRIRMAYPNPADENLAQAAQSDQALWQFAFDGSAQ